MTPGGAANSPRRAGSALGEEAAELLDGLLSLVDDRVEIDADKTGSRLACRVVRRPQRARWAVWLVVVALAAVGTGCSSRFGVPKPATSQSGSVLELWRGFFVTALVVGAFVWTLIIVAIIRFRHRPTGPDDLPPQTREHIPLELTYTAIPIAIVAVLFGFTVGVQHREDKLIAHPALAVHVEGFQWGWRFTYKDQGVEIVGNQLDPPELVLPVDQTVRLEITAPDVIHSFYVPAFLFKRDAIPGFPNEVDLHLDRVGTFEGKCAEFCGLNHGDMGFTVHTMRPDDFRAWLATHSQASQRQ